MFNLVNNYVCMLIDSSSISTSYYDFSFAMYCALYLSTVFNVQDVVFLGVSRNVTCILISMYFVMMVM